MALNHTHTIYDPLVLANEIEDMYLSKLDLNGFVTVNNDLVGVAGDTYTVHKYTATSATERLAMGAGNTKKVEVDYDEEDYTIQLAQTRFAWYDEEAMKDTNLLPTGVARIAADMYQCVQDDIYSCFTGAGNTQKVTATGNWFNDIVDAVALLPNYEDPTEVRPFLFVPRAQMAAIRKSLKDDLKYVEAFARTGYVGTVAGVDLYVKADADANKIVGGTRNAVTLFNKKGVEVEYDRDPNTRLNWEYARKYYVAALTDASEAFMIDATAASGHSDDSDSGPQG